MTDQRASRHVAVFGVAVFERGDRVGGTWVYTPRVESDPLGLDPDRPVHSTVYESLRTHLPRELMGIRDFPVRGQRRRRRAQRPEKVSEPQRGLVVLDRLCQRVRFETEVVSVSPVESETRRATRWRVVSKKRGCDSVGVDDEVFDAVLICNGHYSEPRVAQNILGIDLWPGKQIHSHNYRTPEPFRDQVIGISASALDISQDISRVVKEAHVAARSISNKRLGKLPSSDKIFLHPMINSVHEDGQVVFEDESVVFADTILHCTGYKFRYPFLKTDGIVTVDDNRVGPLYKHVFPPALAPWLSFVGIPLKTLPFPLYELQSKWISRVLSNRIKLPSKKEMVEDIAAFYATLERSNVPKRYTHDLCRCPFEYEDWLAGQCGCPAYEEWRKEMLFRLLNNYVAKSVTYCDDCDDDEDLVLIAKQDF